MMKVESIEQAMQIIDADSKCEERKCRGKGCYIFTLIKSTPYPCEPVVHAAERLIVERYRQNRQP